MLPYENPNVYKQIGLPNYVFKMPRVVFDQRHRFESDELFRRLGHESEVRYTGYRDKQIEERQTRFTNGCRDGHTEVAFVNSGTNLQLLFNPCANSYTDCCDFDKEKGKVHIRSSFIMDGVCVRWKGWLDLERLDGVGCLEFDEERAQIEDALLREHIERYNQQIREFDEKQRLYRTQHQLRIESEIGARRHHHQHGRTELSPTSGTSNLAP